ncbi:MAG: cation-translocating P-type ATPase, partial [Phycisphaerae bacterium]|nr:cation-translocating P-type ATPase [Phycisphaerae bacterium]
TLLTWAASAEQRSNHPLAQTIVNEALNRELTLTEPEEFEVLEGMGVRATIDGKRVAIGSRRVLLDELHLEELPDELAEWQGLESPTESIPVFVIVDGQVLGTILLADQIRPEASAVCAQLRAQGIRRICLLTGDRKAAVQHVARAIGANDAQGELLPSEKVEYLRNLQQAGHTVAMLGDGINDAPSLTVADIGIAMGIHGTDVATEASDAVLLQDDLKRLPFLIALSKATHRAIVQNLLMAMLINIVAIIFAAAGYLPPWAAAIIHNLGGVLVFLNSFRLANFKWQFATSRRPAASPSAPPPPATV